MKKIVFLALGLALVGCGYDADNYAAEEADIDSDVVQIDIVAIDEKERGDMSGIPIGDEQVFDSQNQPPTEAWLEANKNELESIEILLNQVLLTEDPYIQFVALEANIENFEVVERAFVTDTQFVVQFDFVGSYAWIFSPDKQAPESFFE